MDSAIDNIAFKDYGLYISTSKGLRDLPEVKQQFFTVSGSDGYEITKRKGNVLQIIGYVITDDLADFSAKTTALYALFSATGTREITIDNDTINCFCKDGFQIDKVRVYGTNAYARFKIKLIIV